MILHLLQITLRNSRINLLFTLIILSGLPAIFGGCQGNRMKIDEKQLSQELTREGKEESERLEREKMLADSLKNLPPAYRFKEDRSVDKTHPPVVIDLAGNLTNIKTLSLSEIASKITYVRLEKVPDTTFDRAMKFKYYLMDNHIVAVNPSGILLYSENGKYLTTVVKNQFTGMSVTPESMTITGDNTFIGGGTTIWAQGKNLYYKYRNSNTGQSYIMEYDCSRPQMSLSAGFDPEKPRQIRGQGKPVFDLNYGNKKQPQKGNANSMWFISSDFLYQHTGTIMLDHNTYAQQLGTPTGLGEKYMMAIFNQRGDTLTTFTQFEKITSYSKSVMRGTDYGLQYEVNGNLFVRSAFNDTVFRVIPPNRLLPVYVLKLGSYKLTKKEGADPSFDLKGKIIPESWAETKNYIFITFAKDSYSCPNTRKNKQLKVYYAIYSKQSRTLSLVKNDPSNYDEEILRNNIDGGVPVWPSSFMIGTKGEILVSLKGRDLKDRVKSEAFSRSTASAGKKNELVKLAGSVSDDEDILMIVQ